ncbi:MAG: ATP-binding cassette domain-containing protein [Gammaproteobacteria bacterium]
MIALEALAVRRGGRVLFAGASLAIHPGQHVGITGGNGTGKTTLFKLLLGELGPDEGNLRLPTGWRIAHMAQETHASARTALEHVIDGDRALRDIERRLAAAETAGDDAALAAAHAELDACDGYNAHYRAEQLLHGLGFSQAEVSRPVAEFSGGWRIRLNLAQALMCPSDLLLLDEPTNHLDLDATQWLEDWLARYPGTLLLISHDRDFLDAVVTHIVHIEQQELRLYRGNYSAFEVQRAERLAQQQALYQRQQTRIKEIESFVRRFRAKATKARQAQSRLKELERMQAVAAAHVDSPFDFRIREAPKVSDPLLTLLDADLGYGERRVLAGVRLSLHPGSRVGLLGANGAGKSTLIKALLGELAPLAGQRTAGTHLRIGYYAQQQLEVLDLDASASLHVQRLSPEVPEQVIRDFIGGFDFRGDAALAPIRPFSGGEKARLALALVAWQQPNLLLLDEPTNHLDLEMRQALTLALQEFGGALVLVSHDRYLLRNCVDEFHLVEDGRLAPFDGDLDDYHRHQQQRERAAQASAAAPADDGARGARGKEARQQAAAKRAQVAPARNAVKKLETQMAKLGADLAALESRLADQGLYEVARKAELGAVQQQLGECRRRLEALETEWLEAQETLEDLEREVGL